MSGRTTIEWTEYQWNPVRGCRRVSEGCRNCYAERMAIRSAKPGQPHHGLVVSTKKKGPQWTGKVALAERALLKPLSWRDPRRVFVNSMSDLFYEAMDPHWVAKVFAVMAICSDHTFQILTKRAANMHRMLTGDHGRAFRELVANYVDEIGSKVSPCVGHLSDELRSFGDGWPLKNVWLGVSAEDQTAADERIPLLLQTPAAIRWVSAEPLLGPITLRTWIYDGYNDGKHAPGLKWIVAGGESGPGARPMHPDWPRALRNECTRNGVAFFFKQWGHWIEGASDRNLKKDVMVGQMGHVLRFPFKGANLENQDYVRMTAVGKKLAGRELDSMLHDEYPEVRL
jgi:protein gp37